MADGYVGGGMTYRGLIPGRGRDRMGLCVAAAHLGRDFQRQRRRFGQETENWEIDLEWTYRAIVTPWLSIQPGFQYVINPGGIAGVDDAFVVGTRLILSL